MHDIDDLLGILVGLGGLFRQQVLAMDAHGDPTCVQLCQQLLASNRLFGSGAALPAPGPMTAGAKTLLH